MMDSTLPNKRGWLNKQGGKLKQWRRRWFRLEDGELYYFTSEGEENSLGLDLFGFAASKTLFLLLLLTRNVRGVFLPIGTTGKLFKAHFCAYCSLKRCNIYEQIFDFCCFDF